MNKQVIPAFDQRIREICREIDRPQARARVAAELLDNLMTAYEAGLAAGLDEPAAIQAALDEFGTAEHSSALGRELDTISRPRIRPLHLIILILILTLIFSAVVISGKLMLSRFEERINQKPVMTDKIE